MVFPFPFSVVVYDDSAAEPESQLVKMTGGKFMDVTAPANLEIVVRQDKKVVWINLNGACIFRACKIPEGQLRLEIPGLTLSSEDIMKRFMTAPTPTTKGDYDGT